MIEFGLVLLLSPFAVGGYAYVGYPLLLRLVPHGFRRATPADVVEWPSISISLPVYNEAAQIRDVLDTLLRLDYPKDRLQILVISDASTDDTDEIVGEYADRGVELLRQPVRRGKTAGESFGAPYLRGEIVINTDASIRIAPDSLRRIISPFADPSVGLVSGRDVSVARDATSNAAESGYVGYEMRVRALETAAGGIIGASGCFYAIRAELHRDPLPEALSRDFASALITREHGLRAISADDAICYVPRTHSPPREYRRKVRTIMRGMETLAFKRHMLHPREGRFAWKLFSHKICRWAVPWFGLGAVAGAALLATTSGIAAVLATLAALGAATAAALTWHLGESGRVPAIVSTAGSALLANIAVIHATIDALRGNESPIWEPTRRETVVLADAAAANSES